jgi:hypothetical protein
MLSLQFYISMNTIFLLKDIILKCLQFFYIIKIYRFGIIDKKYGDF